MGALKVFPAAILITPPFLNIVVLRQIDGADVGRNRDLVDQIGLIASGVNQVQRVGWMLTIYI